MSNYNDVRQFQLKFNQLVYGKPGHLTQRKLKERVEFLLEELLEFAKAGSLDIVHSVDTGKFEVFVMDGPQDLAEQADGLVDLVYVALGTAVMMGLPWDALWSDVHRANMAKERGVGPRGHLVDCVKPPGWVGPKTMDILEFYGYQEATDSKKEHHRDDAIHLGKTDNL